VALYTKQPKEAIAQLQQANQQDPFIQALLARAFDQVHDRAAAADMYAKVMQSNAHSLNNAFARAAARGKTPR